MATAPSQPSPRFERTVVVSTYNTIELEEHEVVRLVTPYSGPYYYNVLNLGPCTIYIRDDHDPEPGDEKSVTLPPLAADNLVLIPDGPVGLRLKAGPPCIKTKHETAEHLDDHPKSKLTMRLVRG